MTHDIKCHCGKRSKFHVEGDEGCGNVCGVHARKYTEKTHTLMVCESCGQHCTGGYCARFSLLKGGKTILCIPCNREWSDK